VVNYNRMIISHVYGDLKTGEFWSYGLDLLGSCDVRGHVTIGLAVCGFLQVISKNTQ